MKKMIFASLVALTAVGLLDARCCGPRRNARVCRTTAPTVEVAPKCFKTIMVPQTIQVAKCVEVPARKIVMPRPDIVERIAQKPIEVRIPQPAIPQPDRIEYRCVPDKIVYHKQEPCIRYECPTDCDAR